MSLFFCRKEITHSAEELDSDGQKFEKNCTNQQTPSSNSKSHGGRVFHNCQHCSAQFKTKLMLHEHIMIHHKTSSEKEYTKRQKCTDCDHEACFSYEKPDVSLQGNSVKDEYLKAKKDRRCNVDAGSKGAFKNHLSLMNKAPEMKLHKTQSKEKQSYGTSTGTSISDSLKKYKCDKCGYVAPGRFLLHKHYILLHYKTGKIA